MGDEKQETWAMPPHRPPAKVRSLKWDSPKGVKAKGKSDKPLSWRGGLHSEKEGYVIPPFLALSHLLVVLSCLCEEEEDQPFLSILVSFG